MIHLFPDCGQRDLSKHKSDLPPLCLRSLQAPYYLPEGAPTPLPSTVLPQSLWASGGSVIPACTQPAQTTPLLLLMFPVSGKATSPLAGQLYTFSEPRSGIT